MGDAFHLANRILNIHTEIDRSEALLFFSYGNQLTYFFIYWILYLFFSLRGTNAVKLVKHAWSHAHANFDNLREIMI